MVIEWQEDIIERQMDIIEWQADIIEWQTDIIERQADISKWQTDIIEWQMDITEWQADIIESAQWILFLIWKLLHSFVLVIKHETGEDQDEKEIIRGASPGRFLNNSYISADEESLVVSFSWFKCIVWGHTLHFNDCPVNPAETITFN